MLGILGGIAGTVAMGAYWKALYKVQPDAMAGSPKEEPSTNKLAAKLLRQAGVKKPSSQTREIGGTVVHWAYGAGWGAAAGLARTAFPLHWGGGQPLALGLWALGDMYMVPRLGLSRPSRDYPAKVHASALGAHLAYGLGLWATMEGLSKLTGESKTSTRRWAA